MYVRTKRHRSASTSRKQGLKAKENKLLYGKQCKKTYKLPSGLSFANDSDQTNDRGKENLPQHLQHIDKQNKTKVRVN